MKSVVVASVVVGFFWIFANTLYGETSQGGDDLLREAQSQFEAGLYSSAISTLQTAISRNPKRAELHYWLERAYYELHDYDNAITHGKRSTRLDRRNSLYHEWLGRSYGGKAGREHNLFVALKVQKEFEEAVRLNSANIRARRDLQKFYMTAPWIIDGNEKAREMVDAIAALDDVEGRLARAQFYLNDLNPDLAETEYILVLDERPNRVEPYLDIAAYYEEKRNGPAIEAVLEYAEKVNPSDPRLTYYRGVVGVLIGEDLEAAEKFLKSYLASHERSDWPSHAAAYEWLGGLYEQEGKLDQAIEQYRAALNIEPERKGARKKLEKLEEPGRERKTSLKAFRFPVPVLLSCLIIFWTASL